MFQSVAVGSVTPERLLQVFEAVFGVSPMDSTVLWTPEEVSGFSRQFGFAPKDIRRIIVEPDQVVVRNFDPLAEGGVFTTKYHLNLPVPNKSGVWFDGLEPSFNESILYNGVSFGFQKAGPLGYRSVFLGDIPIEVSELLKDRVRLSVVDNPVLNLWHRRKDQATTQKLASQPQRELVDFFYELFMGQQLKKGALGQLPTGMGKTQTILFLRQKISAGLRPKITWLVHGKSLIDQTYDVFSEHPQLKNESILRWYSDQHLSEADKKRVATGDYDHLIISVDSFSEGNEKRELWKQWLAQQSEAGVLCVFDEVHQIESRRSKKNSRKKALEFIQSEMAKHANARSGYIGLSATPKIDNLDQYFAHRHYAFVGQDEVSPEGTPHIGFLSQLQLASWKGYMPVPLFYRLGNKPEEMFEAGKGNTYHPKTVEKLLSLVRQLMPAKIIFFHSPGTNEFRVSTYAMLQFHQEVLKEFGSSFPSFYLQGEMSRRKKDEILNLFKQTRQGLLNLTAVGSAGLDIPDCDTVVLVDPKYSEVLNLQRKGRVTRAAPHKSFYRSIDFTGRNFDSLIFSELKNQLRVSPEKRRKVKDLVHLFQETGDTRIIDDLYKTLGIDPHLIRASPEFFLQSFKEVKNALSRSFHILAPYQEKLPPPLDEESLESYLKRADVLSHLYDLFEEHDSLVEEKKRIIKPALQPSDRVALAKMKELSGLTQTERAHYADYYLQRMGATAAAGFLLNRVISYNLENAKGLFHCLNRLKRSIQSKTCLNFDVVRNGPIMHLLPMPGNEDFKDYLVRPEVFIELMKLFDESDRLVLDVRKKKIKPALTIEERAQLSAFQQWDGSEQAAWVLKMLPRIAETNAQSYLKGNIIIHKGESPEAISTAIKKAKLLKSPKSYVNFELSPEGRQVLPEPRNENLTSYLRRFDVLARLCLLFEEADAKQRDERKRIIKPALLTEEKLELLRLAQVTDGLDEQKSLYNRLLLRISGENAQSCLKDKYILPRSEAPDSIYHTFRYIQRSIRKKSCAEELNP